MMEKKILLLSAFLWVWCKKNINKNYVPLWTLHPIASRACQKLPKCGCNQQNSIFKCSSFCGCRRSKQHCTKLFKCKVLCKWWESDDENDVKLDNLDNMPDEDGKHFMFEDQEEPFHMIMKM